MSTSDELPPLAIYRPHKRIKATAAARRLHMDPSKFFRWISQGRIRAWRLGRSVYILKSDLRQLIRGMPGAPLPFHRGTAPPKDLRAQRELQKRGLPTQR